MESILPSSHRIWWTPEPGLRLRPVPEQNCCLVYRPPAPAANPPRPPMLHGLNVTAWLVLTLCDGRDEVAIEQEFAQLIGDAHGAGASKAALHSALGQLRTLGLIHQTKGEVA